MQHELLFSELRTAAEGAPFLETIRDSSSGEYSHRVAAMEQIFESMIHDCRERVRAQAKETSQQRVHVVQPNDRKSNKKSTVTSDAQPGLGLTIMGVPLHEHFGGSRSTRS